MSDIDEIKIIRDEVENIENHLIACGVDGEEIDLVIDVIRNTLTRLEQKETCKENGEKLTGDDEHVNKTANPLQEQGDGHVHLSHCNQGEYLGGCKYGESDICPALQKEQPQGEALDNPLRYFTENVDAWTEKEWFERLFSAVNDHDKARRDRDDLMADSYINIMNSCAFALARDFPNEIRAALTRGDCAVGDGLNETDISILKSCFGNVLDILFHCKIPNKKRELLTNNLEVINSKIFMLSAAPKVESESHNSEWFFRWIARGKAGYVGHTLEQCVDMIWHSPDNPYKDENPWETAPKQEGE